MPWEPGAEPDSKQTEPELRDKMSPCSTIMHSRPFRPYNVCLICCSHTLQADTSPSNAFGSDTLLLNLG